MLQLQWILDVSVKESTTSYLEVNHFKGQGWTFTLTLSPDSQLPHEPIYFNTPWVPRSGTDCHDNRATIHFDTWM